VLNGKPETKKILFGFFMLVLYVLRGVLKKKSKYHFSSINIIFKYLLKKLKPTR
jgi:hypothetical protein